MKYVSKRGTTINIPDGATPQQIAKIKARADSGYGVDAQRIADSFKKKGSGSGGGKKNEAANPAGTDNLDSFLDSIINQYNGYDDSGIPGLASEGDIQAARQKAYDANYSLLTQGVEEERAKDLEAKKQELAQRGIPFNAGGDDLYSRSVGDVDKRYDTIKQNAGNQATAAADAAMQAFANTNAQQRQSYMDQQGQKFNSWLGAFSGVSDAALKKYGLTRDDFNQRANRRMQWKIAQLQSRGSGGSSGGGGGSSDGEIYGGNAPGWGV